MSIASANVAPDLSLRRRLSLDDLRRLDEPAVLFEHHGHDSDGEPYYVYTVAGWLDGANVATMQGGCTVGPGEAIIINADSREDADHIAAMGLWETINALDNETEAMVEAAAAMARLSGIGAVDRLDLATALPSDKSDQFERDSAAIRPLRGDDIVLSAGAIDAD